MLQIRAWKIALVVAAALFGLLFTLPNLVPAGSMPGFLPGKRLNLGLDLQGGSYLLLSVDTAALRAETLSNLAEDVRRDLQTAGVPFSGPVQQGGVVSVTITDPAKTDQGLTALQPLNQQDAAGTRPYALRRNGQTVSFTSNPGAANAQAARAVEQSIEIIRRRIDQLGTREPTIIRQGADRIVVQAPGESDPDRLKRVIGQTAKLSFQMVDETVTPEEARAGRLPPGSVLLPSEDGYDKNGVVVKKRIVVDGGMLTDARPSFDQQTGRDVVSFRFNGIGTSRFAETTTQNVHKRFAIVLDNKVISAPTIQEPITGGSGQISGSFTTESANDLAVLLRAGALPAPLKVEQQQSVGAELGADAVKAGQVSTVLGFVLICCFMILAYGFLFGGVSVIGLIINGLLIVAAMSVTQATLTLPGIAGLILTLAVAVDANVLIYERMREEARAGRTVLAAMNAGFSRAMVTIIDANVTTLVAALIMFVFGAGAVRGFAWTLSIGVFTSIFSAVMVSQVLLGFWFRRARPKALPIS